MYHRVGGESFFFLGFKEVMKIKSSVFNGINMGYCVARNGHLKKTR